MLEHIQSLLPIKDVKIESEQEWEGLSAGEHLELISKEGMFSAVFVACDWMKREEEVIQLCVKTANSLWTAMAKLLNLLKVDLEQLRNSKDALHVLQISSSLTLEILKRRHYEFKNNLGTVRTLFTGFRSTVILDKILGDEEQ